MTFFAQTMRLNVQLNLTSQIGIFMLSRYALVLFFSASMLYGASSKPKKQSPAQQPFEQSFNQGYDLQKKGDYAGAIDKYSEAISLNSSYAEAYNNRAYCYKMVAKDYLKLSGLSYEKALKLKPNFPEALEYQGTYFLMTGEIKKAYNNYKILLSVDEDEARELKKELDPVLEQAKDVLKQIKS